MRRNAIYVMPRLSGNSLDDLEADWIDYKAIGVNSEVELREKLLDLLRIVDLDDDVYTLGLRGNDQVFRKQRTSGSYFGLLVKHYKSRLQKPEISQSVELFDSEKFNTNASVAENLLFGTPVGDEFILEKNSGEPIR